NSQSKVFFCELSGFCVVRRDWDAECSEMGLEEVAQLPERFATVADRGFRVAGFGKRLTVGRVEEDRVVAEAAGSPRLRGNASVHRPARFEQHLAGAHQRQRADEMRRALTVAFLAQ